ncbi:MAG: patatin-like phospholipase family protein [Kiloniellaceae bacterium]
MCARRFHRHGRSGFRARALLAAIFLPLLLIACTGPVRLSAVPDEHTTQAIVPGIPEARFWVDKEIEPFLREALHSFERERAYLAGTGHSGALPPVSFLAVSGGGDNGAFGAGLLKGWTEHGGRPVFKAVTGVSTGALIAPLAFLGSEYDDTLEEAYTAITKDDIFEGRGLLAALFDDALADTFPMSEMIARFVTQDLLDAIAEEYEKGRLLFVGTTNLDARRPIVWNMTAIAASRSPGALALFQKILLASAAVPGAFPPVMIDVEVDGDHYQEMHVDGGAMTQVFLYPPTLNIALQSAQVHAQRERHVYIIRNARLDPEWADVERRTFSIAGRAISSLIHSQGIGDLYRIYLTSQRDGFDYNLAYIGADFDHEHDDEFDQAFMRALYEYAFELGRRGYPWRKTPPDFDTLDLTPTIEADTGVPSS